MNRIVEIIVPVYNVEEYLPCCVESLLCQTFKSIRIWLVDDGSKDACSSLCDEYASHNENIVVLHKENGGLSSARNAALNAIFSLSSLDRGGYLSFVDADDWVEPDYVEYMLDLLVRYDADIVQIGQYIEYSNRRKVRRDSHDTISLLTKREAVESLLRNGRYDVSACCKLFKAGVFSSIRFPEGRSYEDTAVAHELVDCAERIVVSGIPKYHYVQRYSSIANGIQWTDAKIDLVWAGDKQADWAISRFPELGTAAEEKRVYVRLSTLSQMVNTGYFDTVLIQKMRRFVLSHGRTVLLDPAASRRDKFGIIALLFGFRAFRMLWKMNYSISRRRS